MSQSIVQVRGWAAAAGAIALVASASLAFDLWLPTRLPSDADWQAAAKAVEAEAQAGDVVLLSPWWAEKARLFFPENIAVVGYQGCENDPLLFAPRVWLVAQPSLPRSGHSAFLTAFSSGRQADGAERSFGPLRVQRYLNSRHRAVRWSATEAVSTAQVTVEGPQGSKPAQALQAVWQEVKFQPRRCLRLDAVGNAQHVARFAGVPAAHYVLLAGYVWDRGAFIEGVSDAELVVSTEGIRRPLALRRGDEGLKTVDVGPLEQGATISVAVSAPNPHDRQICFELYGLERAP